MRWVKLSLLFVLVLPACGRSLEKQTRDAIRDLDGLSLSKNDVEVVQVSRSGDFAVAEVKVKTALKLKKNKGEWVVEEIRMGDRRWEKADHILALLREKRTETTRKLLGRLKAGIEHYSSAQGEVPQVADFESLVDLLAPRYMDGVVRLDAWSRPFFYQSLSARGFDLRSAGPDGAMRTADDLAVGSH
ncbi:MAG: type II secretion system protein GspG [Acidobacteriota bacterium]